MVSEATQLSQTDVRKLLGAASPDGALLYIYIKSGNAPEGAERDLHLNPSRIQLAMATLRQLGLIEDRRNCPIAPGERPAYSEQDVLQAVDQDGSFRSLYGEIQRTLGRSLNTEELKILLGITRYLGMGPDLISVLITYCKGRAREKGSTRNPSLRSIEKEAYAWAERGIDTVEEASAFIQSMNVRNSRLHRLMQILQIRGRNLTNAEERYAVSWLEMNMEEDAIRLAYEKTCLNTGGLNWAYMNKILQRWNSQGLRSAEAIRTGEARPAVRERRELDSDEQAAIDRLMREE